MQIPGATKKRATAAISLRPRMRAHSPTKRLALLDRAIGVDWYRQHASDIDRAALALCRLRRARAGERGGPESGDEAVRAVLAGASPQAVSWLASRAISYMDESGFPEAVEMWFPDPDADRVAVELLAVSAPQEETEREQGDDGEIRGERHLSGVLPLDHASARCRAAPVPCASRLPRSSSE